MRPLASALLLLAFVSPSFAQGGGARDPGTQAAGAGPVDPADDKGLAFMVEEIFKSHAEAAPFNAHAIANLSLACSRNRPSTEHPIGCGARYEAVEGEGSACKGIQGPPALNQGCPPETQIDEACTEKDEKGIKGPCVDCFMHISCFWDCYLDQCAGPVQEVQRDWDSYNELISKGVLPDGKPDIAYWKANLEEITNRYNRFFASLNKNNKFTDGDNCLLFPGRPELSSKFESIESEARKRCRLIQEDAPADTQFGGQQ